MRSNDKFKIAFIINELNIGGAQTMLLRLVTAIDKKKYDVHVFVRGKKLGTYIEEELKKENINITFMDINEDGNSKSKLIHKTKSFKKFKDILDKYNPDLIHVHIEMFYTFIYANYRKNPVIMTIHSQPKRIATKRLKAMLYRLNKKRLLTIVGTAKIATKEVRKVLLKSANSVETIYNPIDVKKYRISSSFGKKPFRYIHIARLAPIKNQKLLLESFKNVLLIYPNSQLIIVGNGTEYNNLKNQVIELDIQNSVSFLGFREDIPELLSKSDVFVLTSNSEVCPMTILEAMASGVCVVSTDVGGVSELLSNQSGFLVEKGNLLALSNALIEVQTEDKKRKIFQKNASERVKKFDSKKIASQYECLYRRKIEEYNKKIGS